MRRARLTQEGSTEQEWVSVELWGDFPAMTLSHDGCSNIPHPTCASLLGPHRVFSKIVAEEKGWPLAESQKSAHNRAMS